MASRRTAQVLQRYLDRVALSVPPASDRSLERTPQLEEAVVWLFRSFPRVGELTPAVVSILERRVRHRTRLSHLGVPELRTRLDRLAAATQDRYQDVADLARTVRFHYLDEPLLRAVVSTEYAEMERHLDALQADPGGPDRLDRIRDLVACRQALQTMLLHRWLATGHTASADAFQAVLLEVLTRRFYRIRDLRELTVARPGGHLLCSADYETAGGQIHLVVAYLPLAELTGLAAAVAGHLADVEPGLEVVVDLHTWRHGEMPSDDDTAEQIAGLLPSCAFGRRLRRLDVTLTSVTGSAPERHGTQHLTFRQSADGWFEEELIYRNLHPMIAKRLDLWRLANFRLRRLPSAADVHVFHGVAHDNPEDQRLFALAEVRDLIPVRDASGAISYPRLELIGLSAISAMRQALAAIPGRDRPAANRIVLSVRPPWEVSPQWWPDLARSFAPVAAAAGLQKVVLRVSIPGPGGELREAVLDVGVGRDGVIVRERPVGQEPIRPVGFDRVMGPNGQAHYWAPKLEEACHILLRHYDHSFVVPGESRPRPAATDDDANRDIRSSPHPPLAGSDFTTVGDVFSEKLNPERKKPFDIRAVLRAVTDADTMPLERWAYWRDADATVVWDAHIGGIPVCLLGLESQPISRGGFVPADGPTSWTPGTLFPQSARKLARAINAVSGSRPLIVLANLSGFDGSPESMRHWQLEYGAEIGRAVTNFRGPIVFVVITRYHGGAFVVFSKRLNERIETAAVEGSFASVIGGAPAAATVFAHEVRTRTAIDPRVLELNERLSTADGHQTAVIRARLIEMSADVRSQKLGEVADEFDQVHSIHRALAVGSVDRIIPASELRPYLIGAITRGLERDPGAAAADRATSMSTAG